MSNWSKSNYEGPIENSWFQGKGKFTFPNGTIYDGEFDKGEFHGNGTLIYPNGGRYEAKWERGKMLEGKYLFYDNLEFDFQNKDNWKYCNKDDRRFYTEIMQGLRPEGKTLIVNDINGPKDIPQGTYDVGEGYFDPSSKSIYSYKGELVKQVSEEERKWILEKCRYNPKPPEGDNAKGVKDVIIQKIIEKSL